MLNPEAKLNKGFANVAVVIIALVVLASAGAGYVVVKRQKTVAPPTPATESVTDETAGWKTYRNDEYGFGFKYPVDWQSRILREGSIDDIVQLFSPESYSIALKGDTDYPTDQFAVRILYNKAYEHDLEGENITFDGKKAIDSGWRASNLGGYPSRIIKIFVDPLITIEMSAPSSNAKTIEEKILSTFKFIDKTADWKTYRNEDYGFEFKYPQNYTAEVTRESEDLFGDPYDMVIFKDKGGRVVVEMNNGSFDGPNPSLRTLQYNKDYWYFVPGTDAARMEDFGEFSYYFDYRNPDFAHWKVFGVKANDTSTVEDILRTFKFTK